MRAHSSSSFLGGGGFNWVLILTYIIEEIF